MIIPSITEQRRHMGLTTPSADERRLVWSQVSVPQAGIDPSTGGYNPHRIIWRLHNGPWRYVAEGGGLRGGKSLGSAMEGTVWLPHSNLIWLAAETYDLCRQEFEYMAEAATSLDYIPYGNIVMPRNKYQPCAFETEWGCRVETRSLHDLGAAGQGASLVARAPDLLIICEPGFAPYESLIQAKERLTTRRGRLWMAGTFEKANTWFVETWHKWARWPNEDMGKSLAVPSWLNTHSFPGGKFDPEIIAQKRSYATLKEFLVRWGGVPMASEALVMGNYWNPRVHLQPSATFVGSNLDGSKVPVELAVDPGYSGNSVYAVLAIQRHGEHVAVVDEVAVQSLVHEEVIDQCRMRPWWGNVTGGVIDPYAGGAHALGATSPQEVWWRHGKVPLVLAPRMEVENVVGRLQFLMRDPVNGKSHLSVNPVAKRLSYEMDHWRRVQTREGLGEPSKINCDAVKALAYYTSAKYTERELGYNPGGEQIRTSDWALGSRTPDGVSIADRYAHLRDRLGD